MDVNELIKKTPTSGIISQGNVIPCFKHNVCVCVKDWRQKRKGGGRKKWRAAADS